MGGADRRIYSHPILEFRRGRRVKFYYNGEEVWGYEGESVAAALYASGREVLYKSPKLGRPRGPFCMIGKCSSCFTIVDGVPNTRSCILPVREGMRVEVQEGRAPIPPEPLGEPGEEEVLDTEVLVVGGGPAGLSAALAAAEAGAEVLLVNEHFRLGGQLVKQTHRFFGSKEFFGSLRGFQVAEELARKVLGHPRIRVLQGVSVYGVFRGGWVGMYSAEKLYRARPRHLIAATGASEKHLAFPGNDLIGVMGAGGAQTLMNEYGVRPGERALVVGSGNVGLIVSYQLLQAGVRVEAVVEILPRIGGWTVHAAKIRRLGIPILTRHTIVEARGDWRVREAVVAEVDEEFNPIPGSEKVFKVDLVLIAVGLYPDSRLPIQAGAEARWIPELGGLVPLRTRYLETSVPGLYVAGDAAGIEEATTAIMEGEVAGLTAGMRVAGERGELVERRERILRFLWEEYRSSPVMERARRGKEKATLSEEEMEELRRLRPPRIVFYRSGGG